MEGTIVDKSDVTVSFIVPAKDEESMLPGTLEGIHNAIKGRLGYEIIVMDNGSTDNTASVAKSKGAQVIYQDYGSIGAVRNTGVQHAQGEYIVFLDADISLADTWFEPFIKVLDMLSSNPDIITGSRYTSPMSAGWIAGSWFWKSPQSTHQITHVPTGHMITTRQLFDRLNGFNEQLETAEDFDFCFRAKQMGAKVLLNRSLVAVHYGMPRSMGEFFRREIWHGAGDVTTLKLAIESRVVIASLVFLIAHLCMLISLVFDPVAYLLFAVSLVIIIAIIVASVWKKYRHAPKRIVFRNIVLFYIYYWGRSIAIVNRIVPFILHRSPRAGRA
jgi:glycosyltransferase involved in cell wall biosynthesis